MKKICLALFFTVATTGQALAFNLDPLKYEFVGQNNDGCGVFYEIASVRGVGDKANVVMIEADPKNRTLRRYHNTIDPISMTVVNDFCDLYDYKNQPLENYRVSDKPTKYDEGSISDVIYKDMVYKGLIVDPRTVVRKEQLPPPPPPPPPDPNNPKKVEPGTKVANVQIQKLTGGSLVISDITENPDSIIADI